MKEIQESLEKLEVSDDEKDKRTFKNKNTISLQSLQNKYNLPIAKNISKKNRNISNKSLLKTKNEIEFFKKADSNLKALNSPLNHSKLFIYFIR